MGEINTSFGLREMEDRLSNVMSFVLPDVVGYHLVYLVECMIWQGVDG